MSEDGQAFDDLVRDVHAAKEAGDIDRGLTRCHDFIATHPEHQRLGEIRTLIQELTQAKEAETLLGAAVAAHEANDIDAARALFQKFVDTYPGHPEAGFVREVIPNLGRMGCAGLIWAFLSSFIWYFVAAFLIGITGLGAWSIGFLP